MTADEKTARIRELNDRLRKTGQGGRFMITTGVQSLSPDMRRKVLAAVSGFDAFSEDNDPHHEHDFGNFQIDGKRFFWKIDYYDPNLEFGSEDPADPAKTGRVLTIMFADEY